MKLLTTTLPLFVAIPYAAGLAITSSDTGDIFKRGFVDGQFCCPVAGLNLAQVNSDFVLGMVKTINEYGQGIPIEAEHQSCMTAACSQGVAVRFCNFQPDFKMGLTEATLTAAMTQIAVNCNNPNGYGCGVVSSELGYTITVTAMESLGITSC